MTKTAEQIVTETLLKIASLPLHACDDARNQAGLQVAVNEARGAYAVLIAERGRE